MLDDAPEYRAVERGPKWSHNQDGEYGKDNNRQQADRQRGARRTALASGYRLLSADVLHRDQRHQWHAQFE